MKIYKLEFSYFSGSAWKYITKTALGQTKEDISNIVNETVKADIHCIIYDKTISNNRYMTFDDLWLEIESDIKELELPLIIDN